MSDDNEVAVDMVTELRLRAEKAEADLARVTAERDDFVRYAAKFAEDRDALAANLARAEGLLRKAQPSLVLLDLMDAEATYAAIDTYFAEQEPRT